MKHSTISKSKVKLWAIVFWLIIWHIGSIVIGQEILLVSPLTALKRLFELVGELSFWIAIANSFTKIISGFLLALVLGILLAIISYYYKIFHDLIDPLMLAIQAMPVASFIILALIWINSSNLSIFISFLMVLPIVYVNILDGLKNISRELIEMTELFKLSRYKKIRYVYLSQISPYLRAACSVSLGICWKSGVAAEIIGLPRNSIGQNLHRARIFLDTPSLFAWTIVIVIISVLFQRTFLTIINLILKRLERI